MSVPEYVLHLKQGVPPGKALPVVGRIIRGKREQDFETLTDDPTRKIVMLFDESGMHKLIGLSTRDMLLHVAGYDPDYLQHKIDEGNAFRLAVFEASGATLATWDGVMQVVADAYPDIAGMLVRHHGMLASMPFDEIQEAAGFRFLDIEKAGASDPRYMTYERYRASRGTLIETRLFLYFTLHFRELFAGDGYTYSANGERGDREYLVKNQPIAALSGAQVVELPL